MHRSLTTLLFLAVLAGSGVAAGGTREDAESGIRAALDQLAAADTLAAIETLRHTELEKTGDPRWFALLGRLYRERGTIESRQESQYVLERAVQRHPDDPGLALELGLTYFAQTFYPDAARHFERALELDPDLCVARYKLGVTHYERWKLRVHAFQDEAEEARVWLARALSCDPENVDAAVRYMNVTYALDEPHPAMQAARSFAARFPASPEFPLMVGTIAYENYLFAMADSAFAVALALMPEDEAAAYTGLGRNVLGYAEMDEYEKAPADQQPLMERAFWVGVDPDPTTDVNQFHLEHMARTFRADLLYSHSSVFRSWTRPQTRGWDTERGEVYIKLGPPDVIYASHGGERFELWTYEGEDPIKFAFVDRTGSGNLAIPLFEGDKLGAVRYRNQVMSSDTSVVFVNGIMDAIAFRDDDFTCSIYTVLHANADSMLHNIDVANTRYFETRTRFFDEQWEVEKDDSRRIPAHELAVLPGSTSRLFDVVRRYPMPFGRYHVACTLEDQARSTQAAQRGVCDASQLARSGLVSSEILFLREGMSGASFSRGGELLMPNPWCAYGDGQRVGVYFEIYNLAAVAGQSRYRITYEIRESPDEPPGAWQRMGKFVGRFVGKGDGDPVVAQSFDRVGEGHTANERMAIDVSVLPAGRHRLSLAIEDLQSGQRWQTSRTFTKSAPAVEVANP